MSLLTLTVVGQRFAVPVVGIPALVPGVLLWCLAAWQQGLLVVDARRAWWWLLAAASTTTVALGQVALVEGVQISASSWGLFLLVWLPAVFRCRHIGVEVYRRFLASVVRLGSVLSLVTVAFTVVQLVGVPYTDVIARVVPHQLLVQGYVISYPLSYGSAIHKSNAWIGLEPSTNSYLLGIFLLAALLNHANRRVVGLHVVALLAAASGSGFAVLGVGILVMLMTPIRGTLRRYVLPFALITPFVVASAAGQLLISRVDELSSDRSSAALRTLQPYVYLLPRWTADFAGTLLGFGAGSSQKAVSASGIDGLLVPTPVKVFFDYGLLAGLVLGFFLLYCYLDGPSVTMAAAIGVSLWVLQPGSTSSVFVVPVLLFVTFWAPRSGRYAHAMTATPQEHEPFVVTKGRERLATVESQGKPHG